MIISPAQSFVFDGFTRNSHETRIKHYFKHPKRLITQTYTCEAMLHYLDATTPLQCARRLGFLQSANNDIRERKPRCGPQQEPTSKQWAFSRLSQVKDIIMQGQSAWHAQGRVPGPRSNGPSIQNTDIQKSLQKDNKCGVWDIGNSLCYKMSPLKIKTPSFRLFVKKENL